MSLQKERTAIFLWERKQVALLEEFLARTSDVQKDGYFVVPLDEELEEVLTTKGVPFRSGKDYRTHSAEPMTVAEEWLTNLFDSKQWEFFRYRGVSLSQLYFFPLQAYLTPLLYYFDLAAAVVARHPALTRCIVFPPTIGVPPRGFCLEVHNIRTVVDVVSCIASARGLEVLVPETTLPMSVRTSAASFAVKQALFGWSLGALNALVSLVRAPQKVRILASDYWANLEPYLHALDSAELFLLDRTQVFRAGWRTIWKFRVRFVHLDTYAAAATPERAQARRELLAQWEAIKTAGDLPEFSFRGFSLRPLLLQALDTLVDDVAAHVLKDIDDTYQLLARVGPDVVELRSTMSGQTHFVILAQVARVLGVPSLEMQHGIEYYGPGSMDRRHSAEHMGVYGPLIAQELQAAEDTVTRHVVGSPRFDVYASLPAADCALPTHGLQVLCIAPPIKPGTVDTYDIVDYFAAVAAAVRGVHNVSVVIKLRAGPYRQHFYERTLARVFEGVPYTIAQYEPLAALFPHADVVVSHYTTATLEALQCGKPVLYFGVSAGFELMAEQHFATYQAQGALTIATTKEEFVRALQTLLQDSAARARLSAAATNFVEREYAFDGKASARAAALITSLASAQPRGVL